MSLSIAAFEGETTLPPGMGLRVPAAPLSQIDAECVRPMAWSRVEVVDGRAVLPGGFACVAPEPGRVLTVPMDGGYLVHVEAVDAGVLVSVEPPADLGAPADDAGLSRLALSSRAGATGNDEIDRKASASRALRRAWSYRRAFERLAEAWPGDGGPVVPARWMTLSYEGRVHVPGVGTLEIGAAEGSSAEFVAHDGRFVYVRRIEDRDGWAPAGAVEVVVGPAPVVDESEIKTVGDDVRSREETRSIRIRASSRAVRLV